MEYGRSEGPRDRDGRQRMGDAGRPARSGRYQKDVAARAIRDLTGVRGVMSNISIKPRVKTADVREKIEAALKRSAEIDARRINVAAVDGKVILTGNVHSFAERRAAEQAAWGAPGVTLVDDRLAIAP